MDVQAPELRAGGIRVGLFAAGMALIVLLAIALRLKGIHSPILDHPAWRQGDTASIARNFAHLQYNIMYPQTTYNGPPPNYVELELQIVPFLAATLYKLAGIHEILGRLITIGFSIGTVVVTGLFARWLFASPIAGLAAAFFFAVFPGSVYYGRTFTPDTTMVFFLTAALYASARFLVEDELMQPRALARTTALVMLAYLAKPVAVVAIVPLGVMIVERIRAGCTVRPTAVGVLIAVPLIVLWLYDARIAEHAEWHWASGITTRHVVPALASAFSSAAGFGLKLTQFREVIGMLRDTMLGRLTFLLTIVAFLIAIGANARTKGLLWGWLAGGLAYTFVVVTVERVDYYMYLLLPLCALALGAAAARAAQWIAGVDAAPAARYAVAAALAFVAVGSAAEGHGAVRGYYAYDKRVYRNAVALNAALPPDALVVIGHYGPDVQYYLDRFGWEEDPLLWTVFDEQSAIRKHARYFVSIEDNRFRKNVELCAWMQRFPLLDPRGAWPVYVTDPARAKPGAERNWRAFRAAEARGRARQYLDAHDQCRLHAVSEPRRSP